MLASLAIRNRVGVVPGGGGFCDATAGGLVHRAVDCGRWASRRCLPPCTACWKECRSGSVLRRATQILQSTLVQVPVVAGYFRPVILVPMSVISGLPASQLEAILAHELAHIRRHDYLVNLLQTLLETVFFYHPAVWWLSRQIRNERENCCDDLAVGVVGSGVDYGRALLAVAELHRPSTALVLGVRDGSLLARVRRILGR